MATPEGGNVYDAYGTVLYHLISTSAEMLGEVESTPLDYETAVAMAEAARAAYEQGDPNSGGGGLALSTTAAEKLHAQKVALAAISERYGRETGERSSGAGGAMGDHSDGGSFFPVSPEALLAHNVRVARQQESKKAIRAAAAARARTGAYARDGGALSVAEALELIFPIEPVDMGDDEEEEPCHVNDTDAAEEGESSSVAERDVSRVEASLERAGETGRATSIVESASHAVRAPSDPAHQRNVTSAVRTLASTGAVNTKPVAPLWRRADVGHLSRLDVVLLYQHLQHRCACESARPRGVVCPNRECIYIDAVRELTRQVTLLCPERGLLLDELTQHMTQSAETYDVLLDSANQYAVRKSTERDLHEHLFIEKAELEAEVRRREHRVSEWRAKYAGLQKRFEEQQAADAKLHEEEILYAKKANVQLVNEIKRLASEAEKAKEKT